MSVPVIDLFAGPGGLGEGFSSLLDASGQPCFKIGLSVEKEASAHRTLKLRSFFRQFPPGKAPDKYYEFLKKKRKPEDLYALEEFMAKTENADREAWHAELRNDDDFNAELDRRVSDALGGVRDWILIGGPPCQAYSLVGRARNKGEKSKQYKPEEDKRHFLYQEYLRIIARHKPAVFVMENVKGILTSKVKDNLIFEKILDDLREPSRSFPHFFNNQNEVSYRIFSLVKSPSGERDGHPEYSKEDFIVCAEKYGIPQARHRVILLGVREDLCRQGEKPDILKEETNRKISADVKTLIGGLPRLRSGISKKNSSVIKDSCENWKRVVEDFPFEEVSSELSEMVLKRGFSEEDRKRVVDCLSEMLKKIEPAKKNLGDEFIQWHPYLQDHLAKWFIDAKLEGIFNHSARTHMISDLHRYFYASCFARAIDRSPKIHEFPEILRPAHKNWNSKHFVDRFKVQRGGQPSTTITSHISKDGHYFIHYDPTQCRSLTVREAARLQTFPDNYFFCGNRTQQYVQVGNAVPPLLASKIAKIVHDFLKRSGK